MCLGPLMRARCVTRTRNSFEAKLNSLAYRRSPGPRPLLLGIVIMATVVVLPTTVMGARGATATFVSGWAPEAQFTLKGSNGYSIQVQGEGRRVSLSVARGWAFTSYAVRGRTSIAGIEARFGNRGRVSVEFRPSGDLSRKSPPRKCTGRDRVTRWGVFVGTIEFVGERGYTEVDTIRARGSTRNAYRWECKISPDIPMPPEGSSDVLTLLEAKTREGGQLEFGAFALRSPEERGFTWFFAESRGPRGRMQVSRQALAPGLERTFIFDEALSLGTVKPPKPFDGTGVFQRNPDGSSTWTGSLTVSFPGAEDVTLTGSRYAARLIQPGTIAQVARRSAGLGLHVFSGIR